MLVGEVESLTNNSNDKIKYIHYDKLTVYAIGAIQEQQQQIKAQQQQIKAQQQQIKAQQQQIQAQQQQIDEILNRLK